MISLTRVIGILLWWGRLSTGIPLHWQAEWRSAAEAPPRWLGTVDPAAHLTEHGSGLGSNANNVIALRPSEFTGEDIARACVWEQLPDGTWRCSITYQSPHALRHVLVFSQLEMAAGSELLIYSPAATRNLTRCEEDCHVVKPEDLPFGRLIVPHLGGELLAIEYVQAVPPATWMPVLMLAAIMQGIGDQGLRAAAEKQLQQQRRHRHLSFWQVGTSFDMEATAVTFTSISSCTAMVACDPVWSATQARGVVAIYVVDPRNLSVAVCTGSIVNGPDGSRVFLLTADHCFANKSNVNNFDNWVVAFNYRTKTCNRNGQRPLMTDVLQGVMIKFYSSRADVLLMELVGSIADRWRPYALGYDARSNYEPTSVVSIHQPGGDVQHISYANGTESIKTNFTVWKFPPGESQPSSATHFEVSWTKGVTTGGSSGAPLIDTDTGLVVGVLTGGPSSCAALKAGMAKDYYGRLSRAWPEGLHRFLSNDPPSNMSEVDLLEIQTASKEPLVVDRQEGRDLGAHGPALNYFPSHFVLTLKNRTSSIVYYLTDAPAAGEIISMDVKLRGTVAGNVVAADRFLSWDMGPTTFTADDYRSFPRVFQVWLASNLTVVPGGILRFIFTVRLSSSSNSSYLQVGTISGVILGERQPWSSYKPAPCRTNPCFLNASRPGEYAIMSAYSGNLSVVSFDLTFVPGALPTVMVAGYCDGIIRWADSPTHMQFVSDRLSLQGVRVPPFSNCSIVLSDYHDLDAVLPASILLSGQANAARDEDEMVLAVGPVDDTYRSTIPAAELQSTIIPLRWRDLSPPALPVSLPTGSDALSVKAP
eukprot:jgi/Botrbrau1/13839/Bobra.0056s0076.1